MYGKHFEGDCIEHSIKTEGKASIRCSTREMWGNEGYLSTDVSSTNNTREKIFDSS